MKTTLLDSFPQLQSFERYADNFRQLLFSCLFLLLSLQALPSQAAQCERLFDKKSQTAYSLQGDFSHSLARENTVQKELLRRLNSGKDHMTAQILGARRVEAKDLALNLADQSPAELQTIRSEGLAHISQLAIITSGAGLWSRGGGQVKALVPYNLQESLPKETLIRLSALGEIVMASTALKVLELSAQTPRESESSEAAVQRIRKETQREIDSIMRVARASPQALNALDMKFVMAAMTTMKSKSYLVLDVWTSQQTHRQIADYIHWLRNNFSLKTFHTNQQVDASIKKALKHYFAESERLGETHLFGYQVGIRAFRANAAGGELAEPVTHSEPIGEGAGMLKSYLDDSGRTAHLRSQGKTDFIFENIEVQNDWALIFGAHLKTNKSTLIVLVPQQAGYAGGNGFVVTKNDGSQNIELHETAVMNSELRAGHSFFNSNTIVQSLVAPSPTALDFELKDNGSIYRAKVNAGDITKSTPTAAIGGRIGIEYENFKSMSEYVRNGSPLIHEYQQIWRSYSAR